MLRKNLKNARKEKGMTQRQVAERLNINIRHYQKMESGEIGGSFDAWDALEDMFGVHQRILREISNNHHDKEANQQGH